MSRSERVVGPDDGQVDAFADNERRQSFDVLRGKHHVLGKVAWAPIAGCRVELGDAGRLGELPQKWFCGACGSSLFSSTPGFGDPIGIRIETRLSGSLIVATTFDGGKRFETVDMRMRLTRTGSFTAITRSAPDVRDGDELVGTRELLAVCGENLRRVYRAPRARRAGPDARRRG